MLYTTSNGSQHLKTLIDDAMSFIVDKLTLPDNVFVEVCFYSKGSAGGCIDLEEDEDGYHQFLVEINKQQTHRDIVATLFHEMKHVEQTATGKLDQVMWMGVCHKDTPYNDRPWEKEAYAFEEQTIAEYRAQAA